MRPEVLKSWPQEAALVTAVCVASVLSQGGVSMSLTSNVIVINSFAERAPNTSISPSIHVWFPGSFAMTLGTFILISGRLGDVFGLKKMVLIGWAWSALWCLLAGFAVYTNSVIFHVICRAFLGIGVAMALPCSIGMVGVAYPPGPRKNFVFALVGGSGPVGATICGIMSAMYAQYAWWPWMYWSTGMLCAAVFGATWIVPNIRAPAETCPARKPVATTWERALRDLVEVDALGSVVGVTGLVLFVFCWNQGSISEWDTYVIVLLVVSVVLIVAFFHLEFNYVSQPLLDHSLYCRKIAHVFGCMGLMWGAFGVWMFSFGNIMMNFAGPYSTFVTAICGIPLIVLAILVTAISEPILSKVRSCYIILFSSVSFLGADLMLSFVPAHSSYWRLPFGQFFVLVWGMVLSFPAALIVLSDFLPLSQQGNAGSIVVTTINYAIALAMGVCFTVETEVLKRTGNQLYSVRQGIHFGVGLAGMAVALSVLFIILKDRDTRLASKDPEAANTHKSVELEQTSHSDSAEK